MNKNYLFGGLGLVAVLLVSFLRPINVNVEVPKSPSFGATASPDIPSPYFSVGDNRIWMAKISLNQSTSTVCSIQSPVATSTLLNASFSITRATSTALVVEIAKSVSPSASTTMLSKVNIAGNAQLTLNAGTYATSSTSVSGSLGIAHTGDEADLTFAPSTYLNVKIGGPNGPLNVLEGTCTAIWAQNSGY